MFFIKNNLFIKIILMKMNKLLEFLSFLFFILLGNSFSNCKERFKFECEKKANNFQDDLINSYLSQNYSPINSNNFNYFEQKEIEKTINPGEVQSLFIFNEFIYTFDLNLSNYTNNSLLVHFYPLDCIIAVVVKENSNIKIETISNYEFNSFYAIIPEDELATAKFKIKILKNTINDYNINRTLHLIINSFEYINDANLIIKEKEPILLNFNHTLDKINLLYNLGKKEENDNFPISISFYVKERVKFKITVSNNEDKIIEKDISYIDRILVDKSILPINTSFLIISIERNEEKDAVMITKIIEDYSTPIYFQKNILNIEFIPTGLHHQNYYMEIFKGEEGEIILNNKRYIGDLYARLVKKTGNNDNIIYDISEYPKEDDSFEHLNYNKYSLNLVLNRSIIENECEEGCYLLFSYSSKYLNTQIINEKKIIGIEFTLLGIIYEEEDNRAQIVDIPLNEYIFGIFESLSINIHYFSVYIPYNSSNLLFEFHFKNIDVYGKKGIKRFNIYNAKRFFENYKGDFIDYLSVDDFELDYLGGQYITFAISYNNNDFSRVEQKYYYFRILQKNPSNDFLVYPLDTNIVNLCKTNESANFSCFFIIDNIYKDLYYDLIINAYGNENIIYTAWFLDDNDNSYPLDINKLNNKKIKIKNDKGFCKIDKNIYVDSKYILINIHTTLRKEEELKILTTFYENATFLPTINLYSFILIYLNPNATCPFNTYSIGDFEYRIIINNTEGDGEICTDKCSIQNFQLKITGKRILSFPIKEEMRTINFHNKKDDNQSVFKVKISYEFKNQLIKELTFGSDLEDEKDKVFPIAYFLKEIEYNGSDINIHFDLSNLNETKEEKDIKIKGYALEYDLIQEIKNIKFFRHFSEGLINGKFDERSNYGLIVFDKDIGKDMYSEDQYYLILIESKTINSNISLAINAISKNDSQFSLPLNKYISGSFNLKNSNIQSQLYYINSDNEENNFTIEFSSNYDNIELDLNNITKIGEDADKGYGGFQKYYVNINFSEHNEHSFIVKLKENKLLNDNNENNENNNNPLETANYILRYYITDEEQDFKDKFNFIGTKKVENNKLQIHIENKNANMNFTGKYNFTYIFNIYKNKELFQYEKLNTIAAINSKNIYSKIIHDNKIFNVTNFNITNQILENNYNGSVFIIIQNIKDKNQKYYYSYSFDISEEKKKKDKKKLSESGIIVFIVALISIIIIIIISIKYIQVLLKTKNLEEKVNSVSFLSEDNDDEEEKNKNDTITFI